MLSSMSFRYAQKHPSNTPQRCRLTLSGIDCGSPSMFHTLMVDVWLRSWSSFKLHPANTEVILPLKHGQFIEPLRVMLQHRESRIKLGDARGCSKSVGKHN
ncbi:hypothetical protein MKW98_012437 [Papaver atlanticum]|uniref:Uncharacterized protein n=1 Tax=Papaver atlanticum TaxID=357466 RepID=A0AAD4RZF9_9MAGN|nr:hypothetical protein MKW98_012437 [Papaver atlanticum]